MPATAAQAQPITTTHTCYAVRRTNILTTRTQVYSVWAPTIIASHRSHGTITMIDGEWYGRVGTEDLPAAIETMSPLSDERSNVVKVWRKAIYNWAYVLIQEAFLAPDGIDGAYGYDMGECHHESDQTGSETRYITV